MKKMQTFFDHRFLRRVFLLTRSSILEVTEAPVPCSQRHAFPAKRVHSLCGVAILLVVAFGLSTVANPSWAEQAIGQAGVDHSVLCKTDWMYRGQLGLSTHYFPLTMDSEEKVANAFQVQTVANQVTEAGAAWFLFTVQHQNWMMMAPNKTFDRIVGSSDYTPDRDIPLDLYRALNEKNVKLMIYVNLIMNAHPAVREAMGGWPPNDTLIDNIAAVYKEYSLRYGDKVAGWWVDGSGNPAYRNSSERERWFTTIAHALRAGNPNALVAISPALNFARYTLNSDITAGESNDLKPAPTGQWLDGAQWHMWTYLGGWWGSDGTRFSNQELGNYVSLVTSRGGALTFEVGTRGENREGLAGRSVPTRNAGFIDPTQIDQIKAIRKYLHPVESAPPTNCMN